MAEEQMDMSLDDIIKAKPSMVKRGRGGGRGRSGNRGGRGSRGGGARGGFRRSGSRQTPYQRQPPQGRWAHDKFEGGRGGSRSIAKLLISNLEYSVNDQDIRELFSEFGQIKQWSVHYDRSGRSLGTADVTYVNKEDAARARKTYNNVPLDGKEMMIDMVTDERQGGMSFRGGQQRNSFNRNSSRGGGFRGGFRGRGRGSRGRGRGGRGGGREQKKEMTAEELDKQLDDYKKKDA